MENLNSVQLFVEFNSVFRNSTENLNQTLELQGKFLLDIPSRMKKKRTEYTNVNMFYLYASYILSANSSPLQLGPLWTSFLWFFKYLRSYAEVDEEYTQKGEIDNAVLTKMRNVSPIVHAHKVKAPTLLLIGSKDLRVPHQQGTEYYLRLKANGVSTR